MATDTPRIARLREMEVWIARVRLVAVLFGIVEVAFLTEDFPPRYEGYAWITTGVFALGAIVLFVASKRSDPRMVGIIALAFDTCVIAAYATMYSFEYGSPTRWALIFVVVEAALRYGLLGAVLLPVVLFPYLVFVEWWRAHNFGEHPGFLWDRVTFPFGVFLITGAIVGWLVNRLAREAALAEVRAREAEALRDELGRRVDVLEAANRCARALASSLDLDQAFGAFSRELRGLLPFERVSLVLVESGRAEVMAVAGRGTNRVFPPGSARPVGGSVLEDVLDGKLVYRASMDPPAFPEEEELLQLGLRSRVLAPLQVGPKTIGMLGLVRAEEHAFVPAELEPVSLLGRLVATAVQNIRSYEGERRLRVARLTRAQKPDGGCHRRRAHVARAVARAYTGAARGVPRADR
ncbi:MAG TPA: GAF domain-containing protein [Gaiellaceae bacterium]